MGLGEGEGFLVDLYGLLESLQVLELHPHVVIRYGQHRQPLIINPLSYLLSPLLTIPIPNQPPPLLLQQLHQELILQQYNTQH